MATDGTSTDWKRRGFTVFAAAAVVLFLAGLGFYTYIVTSATPLHPKPEEVTSVSRQAPSPQWAGAVEQGRQIVRATLSEQNLPGVSVAVGAGGGLVWAEGFGWADLESHAPVSPSTRFRIGSASAALTAAGVGLLVEKDRLKLDQEIQTYVPAFPDKQWPVTLRQLMAHVGGVRHYSGEEFLLTTHCSRAAEGLQVFANDPLRFEPGTRYRYSIYGFVLVSAAVEAAAGEPFFTFMSKQIFAPLGMEATTADVPSEPMADRATFYFPRFKADPRYGPDPATPAEDSCAAGASGFLSTPSDLVRFGLALAGGKLLQPATVTMLQTPQKLASGEPSEYGLGWALKTVPLAGQPARLAGHGRSLLPEADLMGGSTSLLMFPDRGLVVAVTSNISFADMSTLAVKIADAFAQKETTPAAK